MAEILVTVSVLREPARIFLNKMCSLDVTDFEKTLLVTLYISKKLVLATVPPYWRFGGFGVPLLIYYFIDSSILY